MVLFDSAILFLFLTFLVTGTNGQLSTAGSFFQQMKGERDKPGNQDRLVIDQEIFGCDRANDCFYLGRKNEVKRKIFTAVDATILKKYG